ncbi:MAG: PEP-CTERM sorting domain-containing protein [Phycisphaeraceae bacterium]
MMFNRLVRRSCVGVIAVVVAGLAAESPGQTITPQQLYNSAVNNGNLNQEPGEGWAWHAAYSMSHFTMAYEAWGDTAWLDAGVNYYEFVLGHMREGPDGYKGWIGPYIYDDSRWADVHIGDAILINPMLDFARIVHENPALQAQYGTQAARYVEIAETHLIEKWDARGTYHDDGRYGAYQSWDHYLNPNNFSQWHQQSGVNNSGLGLPFNKNNSMGTAALRLWQITGDEAHLERAVKVFSTIKSRMQHYDGTAIWNYWEPTVRSDITGNFPDPSRHWINVHPNRNYQAGEVAEIVEAYHAGIVFDEDDIQRILNTNLDVMWNGSLSNPDFTNSNANIVPGGLASNVTAGTLWRSLADFDQTVRDLMSFGGDGRGQIERAYFENVTLANGPGFDRLHAAQGEPVWLFEMPFEGNTQSMYMALTIPSAIEPGVDTMTIGVRSHASGILEIAVYDDQGEHMIHRIFVGGLTGGWQSERYWDWNGLDASGQPLAPGDYRIRWTLGGDGYREAPITIVPEPGTLALLGVAGLLLMRRRRAS